MRRASGWKRSARGLRPWVAVALEVLAVVVLLELALRLIEPHHRGLSRLLQRPTSAADFESTGFRKMAS